MRLGAARLAGGILTAIAVALLLNYQPAAVESHVDRVYEPVTGPFTFFVLPSPTAEPTPTASPTRRAALAVPASPRPAPIVSRSSSAGARHSIRGIATYYCWPAGGSPCMAAHPYGGMYAAAGPALRAAIGEHWRGTVVTVCATRCARVTLADWCACGGGHLIDLYHDALVAVTDSPWGGMVTVRW